VRPSRGRLLEVLVAVDGPGAYAEHSADVPEIRAGEVEAADVLPLPDQTLVSFPRGLLYLAVVVPRPVGHDGPGSEGPVAPVFGRGLRRGRPARRGALLQQELLDRMGQVVQQVPAVGYLGRAGGALGQRLAVDVRAVAGGGLYPRVPLQPSGEALLRPFGQQVHHPVPLEVYQDRPVTGPATEGEVVDAKDPHLIGSKGSGAFGPREQGVAPDE
jgi:hypothetical protein